MSNLRDEIAALRTWDVHVKRDGKYVPGDAVMLADVLAVLDKHEKAYQDYALAYGAALEDAKRSPHWEGPYAPPTLCERCNAEVRADNPARNEPTPAYEAAQVAQQTPISSGLRIVLPKGSKPEDFTVCYLGEDCATAPAHEHAKLTPIEPPPEGNPCPDCGQGNAGQHYHCWGCGKPENDPIHLASRGRST